MVFSRSLLALGLTTILLFGCSHLPDITSPAAVTPSEELPLTPSVSTVKTELPASSPAPSPTKPKPTATTEPMIAVVNGISITLREYEAELAMFEAASGEKASAQDEERVLDDMVNQALLDAGAAAEGLQVDQAELEKRLEMIKNDIGGQAKLDEWKSSYQFDDQTFRRVLERSVNAALMRDEIIAGVPETAEQVHVRQVLFASQDEAEDALAGLEAGNSFDNLANEYDPITGGDLGWFPLGGIVGEEMEEIAFGLDVEEFSQVFETPAGFHIIMVLERDPQRALEYEARLVLQANAIEEWLEQERQVGEIEIFAP